MNNNEKIVINDFRIAFLDNLIEELEENKKNISNSSEYHLRNVSIASMMIINMTGPLPKKERITALNEIFDTINGAIFEFENSLKGMLDD